MSNDFPSWEEWDTQLSDDQRKYSLYKTLKSINDELSNRNKLYDARFKILEARKKLNTVESLVGGVVGGIIAILGGWAFWKGPQGP